MTWPLAPVPENPFLPVTLFNEFIPRLCSIVMFYKHQLHVLEAKASFQPEHQSLCPSCSLINNFEHIMKDYRHHKNFFSSQTLTQFNFNWWLEHEKWSNQSWKSRLIDCTSGGWLDRTWRRCFELKNTSSYQKAVIYWQGAFISFVKAGIWLWQIFWTG